MGAEMRKPSLVAHFPVDLQQFQVADVVMEVPEKNVRALMHFLDELWQRVTNLSQSDTA